MSPALRMTLPPRALDLSGPEGRQALVARYADALYRWAWARTGGDAEAAEEVVQGAFLAAFERPSGYDPDRGEPWGWLVGLALNRLKALRRGRRGAALEQEMPAGAGPPHPMEAEEERRRVRMSLTALPPAMQRILEAHYLAGKPVGDLAAGLGISPSTAWERLNEAKEAFRKAARRMGVEHA